MLYYLDPGWKPNVHISRMALGLWQLPIPACALHVQRAPHAAPLRRLQRALAGVDVVRGCLCPETRIGFGVRLECDSATERRHEWYCLVHIGSNLPVHVTQSYVRLPWWDRLSTFVALQRKPETLLSSSSLYLRWHNSYLDLDSYWYMSTLFGLIRL